MCQQALFTKLGGEPLLKALAALKKNYFCLCISYAANRLFLCLICHIQRLLGLIYPHAVEPIPNKSEPWYDSFVLIKVMKNCSLIITYFMSPTFDLS